MMKHPQGYLRESGVQDIPVLMDIRFRVHENKLSNPALVTPQLCEEYLCKRGKGWVYVLEDHIRGFGILDLQESKIWALFVHPDFEKNGIGRRLHDQMLQEYFSHQKSIPLWLSTDQNTRAEKFYRNAGWTDRGPYGKTEIQFTMDFESWIQNNLHKI